MVIFRLKLYTIFLTQFQEYYSYSFVGMVGEIGGWTGILLGLRLLISLYILRAHTYYIGTDFPLAMIVSNGIFVKILLELTFNEIDSFICNENKYANKLL